jgi:hypothetical protein
MSAAGLDDVFYQWSKGVVKDSVIYASKLHLIVVLKNKKFQVLSQI